MEESLDFRYFGIIPDDLVLMRRIVAVLNDNCKSQSKSVHEADALIKNYAFRWDARRDIRHFFETGGLKSRIDTALPKRKLFEKLSQKHDLFSLVLKIFHEYETYVSQYEKTRAFIKKQRSLASQKRHSFFTQVAQRDGSFCRFCQTSENLKLDHIYPVVLDGLSTLDNFQLLCFRCNSNKGKEERTIQHPQAFYSCARNLHEAQLYLLTAISYCENLAKLLPDITHEKMAEGHRILRALDKAMEEIEQLKPFYDSDLLAKEKIDKIKLRIEKSHFRIAQIPGATEKARNILQECELMAKAMTST